MLKPALRAQEQHKGQWEVSLRMQEKVAWGIEEELWLKNKSVLKGQGGHTCNKAGSRRNPATGKG